MTVQELIDYLNAVEDKSIQVVHGYDSTYAPLGREYIGEIDEHDWLPDASDKTGKSLQPTGKKVYIIGSY